MHHTYFDPPSPPPNSLYLVVENKLALKEDAEICTEECCVSRQVCVPEAEKQVQPLPLPGLTRMNARRKTVLVVENNESLLREFSEGLNHKKYLLRSARCADEGLSLYAHCGPFFAVVVENCLIELAAAIRQRNPKQRMVIVAFAHGSEPPPLPSTLRDVRLLTEMSNLPKILDELRFWATKEEVDQASQSLSDEELNRLRRYAGVLVSRIKWAAAARDGDDLLQEALLSTFKGSKGEEGRRWDKEDGDFATYLAKAMKSTANNWKEHEELERQLCQPWQITAASDEPEYLSMLDRIKSREAGADRRLLAREKIELIFKTFEKDETATKVLRGWSKDMTQFEITKEYKLSEGDLKAAVKRIRTSLSRKKGGWTNGERTKLR